MMSKRLQVVMDEQEYDALKRKAEGRGLTLAEWVRQALRRASRQEPIEKADRKLAAVRAAVRHSFPTGDIDQMLREIESGYLGGEAE